MKEVLLVLTLLFCMVELTGQTKCDSLFKDFKSNILFEIEHNNGSIVWDDETNLSHYFFAMQCPTEELKKFIGDTIPEIRSLIFYAIAQKTDDLSILNEILQIQINDTLNTLTSPHTAQSSFNVNENMKMILDLKKKSQLKSMDYQRKITHIQTSPKLLIPGMKHGYIPLEELLSIDSLNCSVQSISVCSFTLHARKKMISSSHLLTNEMKRQLKKLKSGDIIFFEEITMKMPDNNTRSMPPLTLQIQ